LDFSKVDDSKFRALLLKEIFKTYQEEIRKLTDGHGVLMKETTKTIFSYELPPELMKGFFRAVEQVMLTACKRIIDPVIAFIACVMIVLAAVLWSNAANWEQCRELIGS
jgi:hypothetical protein